MADSISSLGEEVRVVDILISYDVVRLLSEQLYASPVKAVEELVVNGWDAGATTCSVLSDVKMKKTLAVFDDGAGMTADQLADLWHIGVSRKPPLATERKQIGKFGIGKLASYAVAQRATYITKSSDGLLAVTINFDDLVKRTDRKTGIATPLPLTIRRLSGIAELKGINAFDPVSTILTVGQKTIDLQHTESWTLVILEDLRQRAQALERTGRLRWVLETAMPYASDFNLFLNGEPIESSKRGYTALVEFDISEIGEKRLRNLNESSGEDWHVSDGTLKSRSFPNGVSGIVKVTKESLYKAGGKSEDLGRSHGFFVRVHKRLVNETDALFGARPLSFTTWYHFAAEVDADDLNPYITASRDDFEQSELKPKLRDLLISIFTEARERRDAITKKEEEAQKEKTETNREYVSRRLVEQPLADALSLDDDQADWNLVQTVESADDLAGLISELYSEDTARRSYSFRYDALGIDQPFLRLDAAGAEITLNEDHALVQEYGDKPESKRLLELFSVAEALLEAYLREANVAVEDIRELLARRDLLLRGLALDESHSLPAIAQALRLNSVKSEDSKALEISVVGALRALGFAASHVSGAGTPDGTAGFQVYGVDSQRLTVEAKASIGTPSLNHMDLAGLRSHAIAVSANGTLLVAPRYPGAGDPESETNLRARQQRVSCWTAEQLALVVESAERRQISAQDIQEIVLTCFGPIEVKSRVESLLTSPSHDQRNLYRAILSALGDLRRRVTDIPRNVSLISAEVTRNQELERVTYREIRDAIRDLAHVSRGLVHVTEDDNVVMLGDLDEIRRRAAPLTELSEPPRRRGTFRNRSDTGEDG